MQTERVSVQDKRATGAHGSRIDRLSHYMGRLSVPLVDSGKGPAVATKGQRHDRP